MKKSNEELAKPQKPKKRKNNKKLETQIQREIIEHLRSKNYLVLRINSGRFGKFGVYYCSAWYTKTLVETSGISDLIAISPFGKVIFLEIKRPKMKQNPAQIKFMQHARKHKVAYITANSIKQLETKLKRYEDK